jgi:hypothetical protein
MHIFGVGEAPMYPYSLKLQKSFSDVTGEKKLLLPQRPPEQTERWGWEQGLLGGGGELHRGFFTFVQHNDPRRSTNMCEYQRWAQNRYFVNSYR